MSDQSAPRRNALLPHPEQDAVQPQPRIRRPRPKAIRWVSAPAFDRGLSQVLTIVSIAILALLLNVVFVSQVQHYASQAALYDQVRLTLAQGAAPTGPLGIDGALIAPGTPVAVLSAPDVGIGREVIVEGTAASQTMQGIGHRRDTVQPCQQGTSVLMARSGAYGGVGQGFKQLAVGTQLTVTMGQGVCVYEVIGSRNPGDPAPPAPVGKEGRLTLTTASGFPYLPTEVYRVDANLIGDGFDRPAVALPTGALPPAEAAMGTDASNLFGLVLLLQLLLAVAIGITWLWRRWGHWQTWIVGVPALGVVGLLVATSLNQWILPNLL